MGGEEEEDVVSSLERKAAVLAKMLPPNNNPLRQLSQEEGISKNALCIWRAEATAKGKLLRPITIPVRRACPPGTSLGQS